MEQLWTALKDVEEAATKEGRKYEGGSMQPLIIMTTRSKELVQARAVLQKNGCNTILDATKPYKNHPLHLEATIAVHLANQKQLQQNFSKTVGLAFDSH